MNLHIRKLRAQSAMEYLMTYGWAILIIAVVLGALFSLGVFSSSSLVGTSCVALSGYYCANPVLSTSGTLSLTIGQATGTPYSSVTAYFVPSGSTFSTSTSYPDTQGSFNLNSGQTVPVTFNVIGVSGITSSTPLGTVLTGQIWLAYSTASASGLDSQIATVTVKAS